MLYSRNYSKLAKVLLYLSIPYWTNFLTVLFANLLRLAGKFRAQEARRIQISRIGCTTMGCVEMIHFIRVERVMMTNENMRLGGIMEACTVMALDTMAKVRAISMLATV